MSDLVNRVVLTSLFLFLFSLILSLILIYITSFYTPKTGRLVKKHWPLIGIVLLTLSVAVSLPLNSLAKEMVVNQDSFQIYLKITEAPIKTPPTQPAESHFITTLPRVVYRWVKQVFSFDF